MSTDKPDPEHVASLYERLQEKQDELESLEDDLQALAAQYTDEEKMCPWPSSSRRGFLAGVAGLGALGAAGGGGYGIGRASADTGNESTLSSTSAAGTAAPDFGGPNNRIDIFGELVDANTVDTDVTYFGTLSSTPTDTDYESGQVALYFKDDDNLYKRPHGGSETTVGASGSGVDVEDDGSVVVSSSSAVNFASDLDVADDGDGTATVSTAEQFVSDGDSTDRQIWVIANGASDPAGAGAEDIIFEEES